MSRKDEEREFYKKFKSMDFCDLEFEKPKKWRVLNTSYGGYSIWIDCNLTDDNKNAIIGLYNLQMKVYEQVKLYAEMYDHDIAARNEILSYNYLMKDDYYVIKKWMELNTIPDYFFFYVKDAFMHAYTSVIKSKPFNAKRINIEHSGICSFESTENSQVIRFTKNPVGLNAFYVKDSAKWKVEKLYDDLKLCDDTCDFQLMSVSVVVVNDSDISLLFYFKSTDVDDPYAMPKD